MIIFGTISDQKMTYQYKIKAVNKGTFATPAIYSEAMYEPHPTTTFNFSIMFGSFASSKNMSRS
ncbi:hypothetical protein KNCP2_06500 [Candidatus Rickettsia kedanie]|uniref:Bacterial alpha-2-macroglobulin MG10 domain-containing protein n=1 Tax=Candidatus Rickettsia kedanie TaxID=3115352 RepID=A0ABP9TW44_9RICK